MADQNKLTMPIPMWLHQEITRITKNHTEQIPYTEEELEGLLKFLEKFPPSIDDKIEDIMIQSEVYNAKLLYKTNNIVYKFPDGWSIAKLTTDDLDAEEKILKDDNLFQGPGYQMSDKEFIKNSYLFSLRDPYNTTKAFIHFYINPKEPDKTHPELPLENNENIQGKPIFNKELYDKEVKEYEKAQDEFAQSFEPLDLVKYIHETLQETKNQMKNEKKEIPEIFKQAKNMVKIYKIAKKEDKIPDPETLALYINVLKLYLQDNPSIDKKIQKLIEKLPPSRQVQKSFSFEECKVLYETIGYLWKIITGNDIIEESKISKSPETLVGNYWMLKNGVLLHGINHFTIIKQNTNIFTSLLNVGGFAIQQYLHSKPNELIKFIIKNGGVRLFVPKDRKRLFAQMSPETYTEWGKSKIKKMDFPNKTIKIIDNKANFGGWKSGIIVKL